MAKSTPQSSQEVVRPTQTAPVTPVASPASTVQAVPATPSQEVSRPTQPSLAVQALEEKLKLAKAASQPVIVEKVSETAEEVVYRDSHGTVRKDTLGGPKDVHPLQFIAPVVPEAVWGTDFEGGKVVSQDESRREIDLDSGARRVDVK